MIYPQHLPNYKHNFETNPDFLTIESEHYIFNFFPNSEAQNDINTIITVQESGYKKIIDFLEVTEPSQKIQYFFYPDEMTKTELMGDDWYAQSIYNEFRVHVLYTELIKPIGPHEDTHLLSLPWGLSIGFFQEGLAEFMVGHAWDGATFTTYVQDGYTKNIYPALESFFRHETWSETDDNLALYFYSLAGLFSTYLITEYGKEKYKLFYKTSSRKLSIENHKKYFLEIFGLSITGAEKEFKKTFL